MEKIKSLVSLSGTIVSDIKNDNLIHYSFQYYSIVALTVFFWWSSTYMKNPYLMIWFVFGILPLMDLYIKPDVKNPTKEDQKKLKREFKYKVPIIVTIITDWLSLIWGIREFAYGEEGWLYKSGILFGLMIIQGSSINVSHEINHKLSKWEKILGTFNLSKNLYMHFLIEHNEGHHKNVSTPVDPASSQLNENLYAYLPKTIIGGYFSAWKIENKLCERFYGTKYTWKNRMVFFTLSYFLIPVIVYTFFGWKGMLGHLLVAFFSVIFLEIINYIEHYGLERKKQEDGTYENVNITHSWNAPHRISNYLLFKLQRHSDHHENSLKPYQTLCSYDESPCLPNGYAGCLLLACYPHLWFQIMNPLVDNYKKGIKITEDIQHSINNKFLKFTMAINLVLFTMLIVQAA